MHIKKISPVTKFFLKHGDIGNDTAMGLDIAGKGLLVPLVIILDDFSKQPREDRTYSALKNPITALIELGLQVPIFCFISKGIEKLANKGLLDKTEDYSFNSNNYRDKFLRSVKGAPAADKLTDELMRKGLTRTITAEFEEVISSMDGNIKKSFSDFRTVDKRLFHLKSRFAFVGALATMPLVCALENKLHPKVMNFIKRSRHEHK